MNNDNDQLPVDTKCTRSTGASDEGDAGHRRGTSTTEIADNHDAMSLRDDSRESENETSFDEEDDEAELSSELSFEEQDI